jgi:hypothetical protein
MKQGLTDALKSTEYLQLITNVTTVSKDQSAEAQREYEVYRDLFLQGLKEIEDADDFEYFVAVKYVETKANWIQMNLRLNYQAVLGTGADQHLLVRAGLMSHFLGKVEPWVSGEHLSMINELLATRLSA